MSSSISWKLLPRKYLTFIQSHMQTRACTYTYLWIKHDVWENSWSSTRSEKSCTWGGTTPAPGQWVWSRRPLEVLSTSNMLWFWEQAPTFIMWQINQEFRSGEWNSRLSQWTCSSLQMLHSCLNGSRYVSTTDTVGNCRQDTALSTPVCLD